MPLNQYFTIDTTFRALLGWIDRYGRLLPPPSGQHLRYAREGPEPIWPGNGVHWYATVYAHSRWQPQVALFSLSATEENGRCSVTMRCLDPNSASWYRAMVDLLAPDDSTGKAASDGYPLPELPATGATAEPLPAAPAPLPASPGPAEKNAPHVPRRPADLRRWKAVWKKIKPLVVDGKSNDYIEGWFAKHDDDLRPTKDLLIKIIAAGEAGLLD